MIPSGRERARRGTTPWQTVAAALAGLALIILVPLYGLTLLVLVAISGLRRAGGTLADAVRRARHRLGTRHRTNP